MKIQSRWLDPLFGASDGWHVCAEAWPRARDSQPRGIHRSDLMTVPKRLVWTDIFPVTARRD